MKRFLYAIIVLFVPLLVLAQTERLYTVNGELPNSNITTLAQDSIGNIWIGTENGLSKYNGTKFINYVYDDKYEHSLSSNTVTTLYVTSLGDVLVGTREGLQIYDADYNRFNNVTAFAGKDTINIHVSSMAQMPDGNILIGTLGNGVLKLDVENKEAYSIGNKGFQNAFVTHLAKGNDSQLWIGAAMDGAFVGDWIDGMLKIRPIRGTKDWKIEHVKADANGNGFFAMQDGVYKVTSKDLKVQKVVDYSSNKILTLLLQGNKLLQGTEGSGLLCTAQPLC